MILNDVAKRPGRKPEGMIETPETQFLMALTPITSVSRREQNVQSPGCLTNSPVSSNCFATVAASLRVFKSQSAARQSSQYDFPAFRFKKEKILFAAVILQTLLFLLAQIARPSDLSQRIGPSSGEYFRQQLPARVRQRWLEKEWLLFASDFVDFLL